MTDDASGESDGSGPGRPERRVLRKMRTTGGVRHWRGASGAEPRSAAGSRRICIRARKRPTRADAGSDRCNRGNECRSIERTASASPRRKIGRAEPYREIAATNHAGRRIQSSLRPAEKTHTRPPQPETGPGKPAGKPDTGTGAGPQPGARLPPGGKEADRGQRGQRAEGPRRGAGKRRHEKTGLVEGTISPFGKAEAAERAAELGLFLLFITNYSMSLITLKNINAVK